MAKISEIMLLQQPEQPALAIEVQTYMEFRRSKRRQTAAKIGVIIP